VNVIAEPEYELRVIFRRVERLAERLEREAGEHQRVPDLLVDFANQSLPTKTQSGPKHC
jgi:hypothetical protein